jgi:hypothetical protein
MKLLTEQNTTTVERKVRSAFRNWAHKRTFETFFEHGQWWVRVLNDDEDETYSACDSSDTSGFCFERV